MTSFGSSDRRFGDVFANFGQIPGILLLFNVSCSFGGGGGFNRQQREFDRHQAQAQCPRRLNIKAHSTVCTAEQEWVDMRLHCSANILIPSTMASDTTSAMTCAAPHVVHNIHTPLVPVRYTYGTSSYKQS